jgi:hypothetical protein
MPSVSYQLLVGLAVGKMSELDVPPAGLIFVKSNSPGVGRIPSGKNGALMHRKATELSYQL